MLDKITEEKYDSCSSYGIENIRAKLDVSGKKVIIEGTLKYPYGGRLILDIDGALNLLQWLNENQNVLEDMADDHVHDASLVKTISVEVRS